MLVCPEGTYQNRMSHHGHPRDFPTEDRLSGSKPIRGDYHMQVTRGKNAVATCNANTALNSSSNSTSISNQTAL